MLIYYLLLTWVLGSLVMLRIPLHVHLIGEVLHSVINSSHVSVYLVYYELIY